MMRFVQCLALAGLAVSPGALDAQAPPRPGWADAVDSVMRAELTRTGTPGAQIAVVEHGRLAYTSGYGLADVETGRTVSERTLFQVGSVTKLATATLLAQLAAAGAVDLHAPISRYVPELDGRRVGTATVHQLLTHSAGWGDSANPNGRSDDAALGDALRVLGDSLAMTEPGSIYSYSNPSFSMAGYVAERATGRPFADVLDSLVLRPAGMPLATVRPMLAMTRDFSLGHAGPPSSATVVRPMSGNSAESPAGFLYASAAEIARLAMALVEGGMLDGSRMLSADAVRSMTTGYLLAPGTRFLHIGYGMDVDSVDGRRRWQKDGVLPGFQALITMWPAEKLAVVVFANRNGDVPERTTAFVAQTVAGIATPVKATPVEREPTAAERAALVGTYRLNRVTIEIRDVNGRLELQRPRFSAPIRMTGTDHFVSARSDGVPVEFLVIRDSAGVVRYLHSRKRAYPRLP
jgi:CubicO group peptidase (beta-lactamase class C family)